MKKIIIDNIELENYEEYKEDLQNYPIYASRSVLTKFAIVMLQLIYANTEEYSTNELEEGEYIEIKIRRVKEKDKRTNTDIDYCSHLVSYFETLE